MRYAGATHGARTVVSYRRNEVMSGSTVSINQRIVSPASFLSEER